MKFKTKPGDDPHLKYKDPCGDTLHAFIGSGGTYALVLWTEGGGRVGMTTKKARKFANAILAEVGE